MKALSMMEKRLAKLEKFAVRMTVALNGQPTRRRKRRKAKAKRAVKRAAAEPAAAAPKPRPKKKAAKKAPRPSGKRDLRTVPEAD